ncbi:MAG: hypothetical protein P4M08_03125 [Oligoflexia bacterium]|nr:hypothetical protein [Oligoflexia bacterium]
MAILPVIVIFSVLLSFFSNLFLSDAAHAADLSAEGGFSFGAGSGANQLRSPSPVIGAEYTFNLAKGLKLGGFYDHTFLSYLDGGTGAIHFMGAVVRATLLDRGFVDLKAGLTKVVSDEVSINTVTTHVGLGAEVGVGYEFKLSEHVGLTPRIAARFLPDPSTANGALRATPYSSVMLAIHF